ncbi:MAG TPA: hypothetical protein VGR96_16015, partial [Acidobacteriaceae bacterium]|nr:hypothetical protein [Acidobacteriaceae bacterium]
EMLLSRNTRPLRSIDMGALPAVAALGCTVDIAYNVLALKVAGASDITPTLNCRAKGKSNMRIQLQLDDSVTVLDTPVITRDYPPGVSKADVYQGLGQLYGLAGSGMTPFPFNANKRGLYSAIVKASECVNTQSGTLPGKYTVCQGYVTNNTDGWRVDVENINGVNLTF